jgi:hypothetical protein
MSGSHNKIIASTAKAELGPLGFKRRGQSRLWLKDHGFWLNVVEFTPSSWAVTVNLGNCAHWLWGGGGFMSLNYIVRGKAYAEFKDEDQFRQEFCDIARSAAIEAAKIDEKFSSFEAIAKHVIDKAQGADRMRPSWFGYYAGVAAGISGNLKEAEQFLRGISDERVAPHAERFFEVVNSAADFRMKANEILAQQRAVLKLPPLESAPF